VGFGIVVAWVAAGCGSSGDERDAEDVEGDVASEDGGAETSADDGATGDAGDADAPDEDAAPGDAVDDVEGEDAAEAGDVVEDVPPPPPPIVADHTVVDRFDDIPAEYREAVRTMWVDILGESHSAGYRIGLRLLSGADARFPASVTEGGDPEPYRTDALRVSRHRWREAYSRWAEGAGEALWYTSGDGRAEILAHIDHCAGTDLNLALTGFGWCWDMTWHNGPGGDPDPVHHVRWAGSSEGGPDGDLRWGLDEEDFALTGNRVSMDTYLEATQAYVDRCSSAGYDVRVAFTTGPVDGYSGESGYQRHLKHEHIRAYVRADGSRILFDYADILCWGDAGTENVQTWTDGEGTARSYSMIHPDNMLDLDGGYAEDGDHIGERGALRLGKAMWWLLARVAGWDGR
jgi:hypothetical protein